MRRLLVAAAAVALVATTSPSYAGHGHATFPDYQRVQPGWHRHHVQHLFGTHGRRVVLWADDHGIRHLTKTYPTDATDTRVQVTYVGPPSSRPSAGPFLVVAKQLVSS